MSVEVVTFGCRLNAYESEVIRQQAEQAQLGKAIIFNTCAVTAEAERQARQAIRRARKENPDARIIVTGCAAQVHADAFAKMAEVDAVIGNEEKLKPEPFLALHRVNHERVQVNDIMAVKETALHMVHAFDGKTRAFIQVQNGCNHRCTFCIIPYGRGNSRSVPIGEIVTQARAVVEQGYREIVLTGVDISDYGSDLPGKPSLGQMVRRLLALVPELPRLRISSIDAVEVDEELYRLIAEEPRLMPHLHISLQAGDTMILKRMKRRHTREQALEFCERVRQLRPDMVFGADIIAGFPTETEEMFNNTRHFITEAGLTYLHVFPYSEREGTPAARMPQLPKQLRKERAAELRRIGEAQIAKYLLAQVGQVRSVLIESDGQGHTEHFAPVSVPQSLKTGQIASLRMVRVENNKLIAEAAL
jgi:threonylcarbamoyladenosine tRNA methylthiotransferase MtaB